MENSNIFFLNKDTLKSISYLQDKLNSAENTEIFGDHEEASKLIDKSLESLDGIKEFMIENGMDEFGQFMIEKLKRRKIHQEIMKELSSLEPSNNSDSIFQEIPSLKANLKENKEYFEKYLKTGNNKDNKKNTNEEDLNINSLMASKRILIGDMSFYIKEKKSNKDTKNALEEVEGLLNMVETEKKMLDRKEKELKKLKEIRNKYEKAKMEMKVIKRIHIK